MARATNSLPVPVAPINSTELSLGATRSITEKSFFITGELPISVGAGVVTIGALAGSNRFLVCLIEILLVDQFPIAVGGADIS